MESKIVLSLYKNSRNAVIGNLFVRDGKERVLATTHPATIAASIFAMEGSTLVFKSEKGEAEFTFPIKTEDLVALASLLTNHDQADFMSGFATFSRFDFLHPLPFDDQADLHLRTAIFHMDEALVRIAPLSPAPKGFKKELRNRNRYVYYPYC
jgi:hypothetical protein